jgi:presenilin-like A22 family membrane protease
MMALYLFLIPERQRFAASQRQRGRRRHREQNFHTDIVLPSILSLMRAPFVITPFNSKAMPVFV